MRILIIGKGSIGQRHARIFSALGHKISFFRSSKLKKKFKEKFQEFYKLKSIEGSFFNLIVIASPTSKHSKDLLKFKNYSKNFLIEKPLFIKKKDISFFNKLKKKKNIFTGYMLRYDKRIQKIKKIIKTQEVLYSNFTWDTAMMSWHKYENFYDSYTSKKKLGGGVINTCCHEIDTSIFLFGNVLKVNCINLNKKFLIDVEEAVLLVLTHANKVKSIIKIDFVSNKFKRTLEVYTKKFKLDYDFKKNNIEKIAAKKKTTIKVKDFKGVDTLYYQQNKKILSMIKNQKKILENFETEKVLLGAHESLKRGKEITLKKYY